MSATIQSSFVAALSGFCATVSIGKQANSSIDHTPKMDKSPRTHGSEPRKTSQPPASTTALIKTTAVNLPSGLLPFNNLESWVFSLCTCTCTEEAEVSALLALPTGLDSGTWLRETWQRRVGVRRGRSDGGVVES